MSKVDFTGSVSHATMREQDLLPAFMDVLEDHDEAAWYQIKTAFTVEFDMTYDQFLDLPEDDDRWRSEALAYILNEDVYNAMQEIAPDGYYFGAHPGDGSDYGFWPAESDDEDEDDDGLVDRKDRCPECDEQRVDELFWHDEFVECMSCGCRYLP